MLKVEWRETARTRDKIIHFYFGIDLSIIWDITTVDIPNLKEKLKRLNKREIPRITNTRLRVSLDALRRSLSLLAGSHCLYSCLFYHTVE
ncbi:MAG: DUF86 domain-containing protein [bacterium]